MTVSDGYYAEWAGLRRRAQDYGDERDFLREAYTSLGEAFLREGRPLGDDQYGAELEKNLPRIRERIFDAFDAYIQEIGGVRKRLGVSAAVYEAADQAGTLPSSPSGV
ncbi:hypothetical protein FHR32_001453 [Streptosporangium album]|uniref:Uncharacterized protein n=1 Tax=Streptosporangium album TaxID=47479 RepID=A0A7W7RT77_9ACTN|nr:hypothetical protein [Streptosporangium album]MBB4937148.1 hypothetical protein [Streptosporangium album]